MLTVFMAKEVRFSQSCLCRLHDFRKKPVSEADLLTTLKPIPGIGDTSKTILCIDNDHHASKIVDAILTESRDRVVCLDNAEPVGNAAGWRNRGQLVHACFAEATKLLSDQH